jgi:transposase
MQRQEKGRDIATHRSLERKGKFWEVPSQSGKGKYIVDLEKPSCTCPDFALRGLKCKHIYAVQYTITPPTEASNPPTALRKTGRPTYRQDWSSYNAAQIHEKAHFQSLLHDICQGIKEPAQNKGRPRLPLREAVFSAAFKVYSAVSTRRFMSDLVQASAYGYISHVPHYNSILNTFKSSHLTPLLHDLIRESSLCLKSVEVDFAVDSSGFSTTRPLCWYNARYGHQQENHDWMKVHLMCGVKTNIVTSVEITGSYANDSPQFRPLVRATARHFRLGDVPADKAYSSKKNLELVVEKGGTPYVPFKENTTGEGGGSPLWGKLWHVYQYHREEFLTHYHKRSNVESTMWMIKSKFNEQIRSKTDTAMVNELLCKVLCHNICVVIQSIYELGIEPTFWAEIPLAQKVPA